MSARSIVLCLLWTALLAGATRADLTCPQPSFHAGQLRTGAALRHRFTLLNRGTTTVRITEVKPSCGCIRAGVDHPQLAPGEQACVEVEVHTVTQAAGGNGWSILVRYREDDRDKELPLVVRADLVPDLSLEPAALVVHTATAITHAFTLTERRDRPVVVRAAGSSSPHIRARVQEPRREGDVWTRAIALEVLGARPDGRHEDVLCLHTGDASSPELKVPFTVIKRTEGRIQSSPNAIELLQLKSLPLPARVVLLDAGNDGTVLIDRVEPAHSAILCTWAAGPGTRSTLRVLVEAEKLPDGPFESSVKVHLRQPAGEVVTIPVRVLR